MLKRLRASFLCLPVGALWATSADAHMGTGLPGGFIAGFEHPLTGFDHMLAMIAVGLWGAFLGRPLIVALPIIFPSLMAAGGVIGMLRLPLPPVELGIALSVIVLGTAILLAWRAPVWLACLLVATFALFHGYAHGAELPSAADPIGYSAGFVIATGLLHLVGIGIGELTNRGRLKLVARGLGGVIAAIGVWFLATAIA